MKKFILILIGISVLLLGTIFVLYKNNQNKNGEVVEIFKEKEEITIFKEDEIKEENENIKKIFVDIKGMIANPGVYEVTSDKRIIDVINIAGGLVEGADTSMINLAKIVSDEMTIIIYSKEEILEKNKGEVCICDCPDIINDACIDINDTETEKIVNINTATKEELMTIAGIGESKANEIILYRMENGVFSTIEDIINVPGIGQSLFEKIKKYITV